MPIHSLTIIWSSMNKCPIKKLDLIYGSPTSPAHMDWAQYYPAFATAETETSPIGVTTALRKMDRQVEVADIGCGFGGLLVALAPKLPDTLLLGKL